MTLFKILYVYTSVKKMVSLLGCAVAASGLAWTLTQQEKVEDLGAWAAWWPRTQPAPLEGARPPATFQRSRTLRRRGGGERPRRPRAAPR